MRAGQHPGAAADGGAICPGEKSAGDRHRPCHRECDGVFLKYGDGGSDFNPLDGLIKPDIYAIAARYGAPECVMKKRRRGWAFPLRTREELGIRYEELACYLQGNLIDMRRCSASCPFMSAQSTSGICPPPPMNTWWKGKAEDTTHVVVGYDSRLCGRKHGLPGCGGGRGLYLRLYGRSPGKCGCSMWATAIRRSTALSRKTAASGRPMPFRGQRTAHGRRRFIRSIKPSTRLLCAIMSFAGNRPMRE